MTRIRMPRRVSSQATTRPTGPAPTTTSGFDRPRSARRTRGAGREDPFGGQDRFRRNRLGGHDDSRGGPGGRRRPRAGLSLLRIEGGVARRGDEPSTAMARERGENLDHANALLRLRLGAWANDEIGPVLRAVVQTAAHESSTREKLRMVVQGSLTGCPNSASERDRALRSGLLS